MTTITTNHDGDLLLIGDDNNRTVIPLNDCAKEAVRLLITARDSSYERGKEDGWQACESCHGIVDGKRNSSAPQSHEPTVLVSDVHKLFRNMSWGLIRPNTEEGWKAALENYTIVRQVPAAQAVPEGLIELLKAIRPEYGAVGSRDIDVARQQKQVDAAIAMLSAPQASTPVSLTGNSTPESFAVPEWMPTLYSWLARARFENAGDEATAALYGNHIRELIAYGQRQSQPSNTANGKEQWFCLSCKSSREGHHGTLDDGVTPCPNGQKGGA